MPYQPIKRGVICPTVTPLLAMLVFHKIIPA